MLETMIAYAFSFLGTPYIYGANGGGAFDCSSLVLECLKSVNIMPKTDRSSQGIYNYLSKQNYRSQLTKGSILFFGKSRDNISHVSIAIDDHTVIESAGGDRTTLTIIEAQKRGAMVRLRPINYRKDLQAVILPNYKEKTL